MLYVGGGVWKNYQKNKNGNEHNLALLKRHCPVESKGLSVSLLCVALRMQRRILSAKMNKTQGEKIKVSRFPLPNIRLSSRSLKVQKDKDSPSDIRSSFSTDVSDENLLASLAPSSMFSRSARDISLSLILTSKNYPLKKTEEPATTEDFVDDDDRTIEEEDCYNEDELDYRQVELRS